MAMDPTTTLASNNSSLTRIPLEDNTTRNFGGREVTRFNPNNLGALLNSFAQRMQAIETQGNLALTQVSHELAESRSQMADLQIQNDILERQVKIITNRLNLEQERTEALQNRLKSVEETARRSEKDRQAATKETIEQLVRTKLAEAKAREAQERALKERRADLNSMIKTLNRALKQLKEQNEKAVVRNLGISATLGVGVSATLNPLLGILVFGGAFGGQAVLERDEIFSAEKYEKELIKQIASLRRELECL